MKRLPPWKRRPKIQPAPDPRALEASRRFQAPGADPKASPKTPRPPRRADEGTP
jgi:hypothetical protein